MPTRIFFIENHTGFRRVMLLLLGRYPEFEVCGEADDGESAIDLILEAKPDLVVADLSLPGINGIELVRILTERAPSLNCVVLSGHQEPEYARRAIAVGAIGYILKSDPIKIIEGIRCAASGKQFVSSEVGY